MPTITPAEKKPAPKKTTKPAAPKKVAPKEIDGEQNVKKALADKDVVRFYVPKDPTNGDANFFERSINGHIIRLRAGDIMELPVWLVEFIEKHLDIHRMTEDEYAAFRMDSGKKLS